MNNLSRDNEVQFQAPKPKPRKKRYFLIGLIVLIVTVVAFGTWLMAPAEVVALEVNYSQGEKMTYEIDISMKMMGQEFSYTIIIRMEILEKEDGIYTIRQSFTSDLLDQTYSFTVRINKTGNVVEFLDVPPELQQTMSSFSFMPGNGLYFPKEEAKVGDSWQIPIDMQTEEFNLTGTINNKITETRRITVPAGTYDVFKLEFTSSEVTMTYKPPPELNMTTPIEMSMTMKGYEYFEKGTCLTVEAKFEQTASISMMGQTISMSTTLNMRLTEHTK